MGAAIIVIVIVTKFVLPKIWTKNGYISLGFHLVLSNTGDKGLKYLRFVFVSVTLVKFKVMCNSCSF
jgi:hypothetical protein